MYLCVRGVRSVDVLVLGVLMYLCVRGVDVLVC
jgi:hypothetical protein